jgi:hypothetical protein
MTIFYCLRFETPPTVFISPRNRVARLYPQALGSIFVTSYDSQAYGGGTQTHWTTSPHHIVPARTARKTSLPLLITGYLQLFLLDPRDFLPSSPMSVNPKYFYFLPIAFIFASYYLLLPVSAMAFWTKIRPSKSVFLHTSICHPNFIVCYIWGKSLFHCLSWPSCVSKKEKCLQSTCINTVKLKPSAIRGPKQPNISSERLIRACSSLSEKGIRKYSIGLAAVVDNVATYRQRNPEAKKSGAILRILQAVSKKELGNMNIFINTI